MKVFYLLGRMTRKILDLSFVTKLSISYGIISNVTLYKSDIDDAILAMAYLITWAFALLVYYRIFQGVRGTLRWAGKQWRGDV
jgi:hypothetical protein